MKSRLFSTCAAVIGFSFLAGLPAWATTQVTLSSAAPAVAEPGLTTIRLLGSGFPQEQHPTRRIFRSSSRRKRAARPRWLRRLNIRR